MKRLLAVVMQKNLFSTSRSPWLPHREGGEEQAGKSLFSILFELIFPPPYFKYSITLFSHPGLSSSPSSLISFSPSSQLFLDHFSLLPILFLPSPFGEKRKVLGSSSLLGLTSSQEFLHSPKRKRPGTRLFLCTFFPM